MFYDFAQEMFLEMKWCSHNQEQIIKNTIKRKANFLSRSVRFIFKTGFHTILCYQLPWLSFGKISSEQSFLIFLFFYTACEKDLCPCCSYPKGIPQCKLTAMGVCFCHLPSPLQGENTYNKCLLCQPCSHGKFFRG